MLKQFSRYLLQQPFASLLMDTAMHRIEPDRNAFRFYRLALWPDSSAASHWLGGSIHRI
jgi:hypothetical protein